MPAKTVLWVAVDNLMATIRADTGPEGLGMSTIGGHAVEFAGPEHIEIVSADCPAPRQGEVVVETSVSAISAGTELLVYRGEVPQEAPADEMLPGIEGTLSYPIRYGYAAVGVVVDIGEGVDPWWLDRTVFGFNPHESHFRASPEDLVPIPESMNPDRAAFLAKIETAVNFVLDANPRMGERVAVFGQGVIGLLTTAMMSRSAAETVIAVEPIEERRQLAEAMGADRTVDPQREDTARELQSAFGGVDIAVEVSGDPRTLESAVDATRYAGRVLVGSWYGTKRESIGLGIHFHRDRIRIESSQVSTIAPDLRGRWNRERRREVARSQLTEVPVDRLITHRIPVEEAERAYELLGDGPRGAVQVLLTYRSP